MFEDLKTLENLSMIGIDLTLLSGGIFQNLTNLTKLLMGKNTLALSLGGTFKGFKT